MVLFIILSHSSRLLPEDVAEVVLNCCNFCNYLSLRWSICRRMVQAGSWTCCSNASPIASMLLCHIARLGSRSRLVYAFCSTGPIVLCREWIGAYAQVFCLQSITFHSVSFLFGTNKQVGLLSCLRVWKQTDCISFAYQMGGGITVLYAWKAFARAQNECLPWGRLQPGWFCQ
jgi:hypothetical protein